MVIARKLSDQARSYAPDKSVDAQQSTNLPDIQTQYQALLSAMQEGAILHDENGHILVVNPAAERILGFDADAATAFGSALPCSVLCEDGTPCSMEQQPWMVALSTGQPQSNKVMGIRRSDGTLAWIAVNSQPLFASGKPACHAVMTVFQDITRQHFAEGVLCQGDAHLQPLLEAIPNPFFIKDSTGRYLACNRAFEDYLGLSRDRILGKTVYDISPKELADRYFAADQELFNNPGTQVYEAKVRWADDSLRDVLFHKATLTLADGGVRGLTGIILDITERKQMELALKLREQQYRTLVEHSPDLIERYDTELRRIYVNPAWEKACGLTASEVINRPLTDLPKVSQPFASEYAAALRQVLASGGRQSVEFSWVNARSETLHLQYVVVAEKDQDGKIISLLAVGRDITLYMRYEEALRNSESHLRRVNRALQALSAGNETMVRATSEQELLDKMCGVVVDVGGHVMASIGEVTQDGEALEPRAWAGTADASLRECVYTKACRPLAMALEQGVPVAVHDIASNRLCSECESQFRACNVSSCLILPLRSEGRNLGAMSIFSTDLNAFDDDEKGLLSKMGDDLAYGIRALRNRLDREEGVRHIQSTMEATIQALANTVEFRDPYTAGHQRRVAQLARAIGCEIGLEEERINGLYLAAVVHDIGKVRVPAEVLTRPGRLSKVEFEIVKTHVEAGYDILKSIDFPWPIANIVRQHHERMDGSGYPLGIGCDELLLESRILSVADVVEAVSSFRPYRPALGIERALVQIEAGRGTLFDSEVVDVCTRLFREMNFMFE